MPRYNCIMESTKKSQTKKTKKSQTMKKTADKVTQTGEDKKKTADKATQTGEEQETRTLRYDDPPELKWCNRCGHHCNCGYYVLGGIGIGEEWVI